MTDSVTEILNALRVLVHALQVGSRSAEEEVGLTGAQLFVLEKLKDTKQLSVNELAALTHTHQSTVSVVVSKLVDKGLVSRVRSNEDARVQQLSITKKGQERLKKSSQTVQERLLRSIKRLPERERAHLNDMLRHVLLGAGIAELEPALFLESKR
jgi:DNA-binding MarR family transcriptional regulator